MRHVQYFGTVTGPLGQDLVASVSLLDLSLSVWDILLFSLSVTCEQRPLFSSSLVPGTLEPLRARSTPSFIFILKCLTLSFSHVPS